MLDINTIIIIWALITGMSILVGSFLLNKKFAKLKEFRLQVEAAEREMANYINEAGIKELSRTQSGRELLQLLNIEPESRQNALAKQARLTEKHIKILEFIANYQNRNDRSPSLREIAEKIYVSSTSTVSSYLNQIEQLGYLERLARGFRFTGKINEIFQNTSDLLRIPILGSIAAGPFMLVPEPGVNYMNDKEYNAVDIARSLLPSNEKGNDLYALEVKGDSMIDAMINDGDIIIMKPDTQAKNGEMVAVRVNDEYTLKYFFREKDRYRLQPANPNMKPIILKITEQPEINGKVVMVIRKMDNSIAT